MVATKNKSDAQASTCVYVGTVSAIPMEILQRMEMLKKKS